MTTISKLKAGPAALLVVAGLLYVGVLALFTVQFAVVALAGRPTMFLVGFLIVWIVSAPMLRAWAGLVASGFLLDFRGLYIKDDRLVFVAPWVRSFALAEIDGAAIVHMPPFRKPFVEVAIRGGHKWRVPGFLLAQSPDAAAEAIVRHG